MIRLRKWFVYCLREWSDWCLRAKAFGVESLYNSPVHEKGYVLDKKDLSPLPVNVRS